MTVEQLIAALSTIPKDAQVYFPERGGAEVPVNEVWYRNKEAHDNPNTVRLGHKETYMLSTDKSARKHEMNKLEVIDCGGIPLKRDDFEQEREMERYSPTYLGEVEDDDMPFLPLGG